MRHADGRAAISEAVTEFINRLRLVETGETEMILRAIDRDVFVAVRAEGGHELLEVGLAAHFTHIGRREIGMHTRAVPVERLVKRTEDGLAAPFDVDAVAFGEAGEDVTSDPHLVGSALGAFTENLELPLTLGDFGVDAFEVNAGIETNIDVLLDDLTRDATDVLVTHTGVVGTLRGRIAVLREAQRNSVLEKEILLLEAEPRSGVIRNRRP